MQRAEPDTCAPSCSPHTTSLHGTETRHLALGKRKERVFYETLQTPKCLPGSLLGSTHGGGTCCPPWLLPKSRHLRHQRHSESLSSACEPPCPIGRGTAPAAGGLGWHGRSCWHPPRLSLEAQQSSRCCKLQTTSGAPWESLPRVPSKQEQSHGERERRPTCYPGATPLPGDGGDAKQTGPLSSLSTVRALISLCCIEGSCIPSGVLTSHPAHCPGSCSFPLDKLRVCQGWQDTAHSKPSLQAPPHPPPPAATVPEQPQPRQGAPKHQQPTSLKLAAFHNGVPLPAAGDLTPQAPAPCLAVTSSKRVMSPRRKGPEQGRRMPGVPQLARRHRAGRIQLLLSWHLAVKLTSAPLCRIPLPTVVLQGGSNILGVQAGCFVSHRTPGAALESEKTTSEGSINHHWLCLNSTSLNSLQTRASQQTVTALK